MKKRSEIVLNQYILHLEIPVHDSSKENTNGLMENSAIGSQAINLEANHNVQEMDFQIQGNFYNKIHTAI